MRVLVAGAPARSAAARPPAHRARPRGRRHDPLTGESRRLASLGARRSCSTCSTRPRCARPSRGRARRDRAPGDRARRRCDLEALRPQLRADERAPDRGHRRAARRCPRGRRRRFVAQSFAGWPYARDGGPAKSEDDPLDPQPVPAMRETLAAIRSWSGAVRRRRSRAPLRRHLRLARGRAARPRPKRRFPIVGDGDGMFSFVHLEDAAAATVLALESGAQASTTSSTTSRRRRASGCRPSAG